MLVLSGRTEEWARQRASELAVTFVLKTCLPDTLIAHIIKVLTSPGPSWTPNSVVPMPRVRRASTCPDWRMRGEDTDLANTAAALESAKGLIRSEVAKQLGMRHAPSLTFVPDAIPEAARHLDEVLAHAKASDAEVEAARAGATYAGEADPYKKPRETTRTTRVDEEPFETPRPRLLRTS